MTARGKRLKYRNDEDFRQSCIARVKAWQERTIAKYPVYGRLVEIRKRCCELRESIRRQLARVDKTDQRLMQLTREKQRLEQEWKRTKEARQQ